MITLDDFKKLEMKVGTIKTAEAVPDSDKLIKFSIDFGEENFRQILSGIREFYPDVETLVGKQLLFVVNLEPRKIRGFESHGMLMAVDGPIGEDEIKKPVFLIPETEVSPGSSVR